MWGKTDKKHGRIKGPPQYVLHPRPGLGQASVSLGAPRMPTNLLHHDPQNRTQKSGKNIWCRIWDNASRQAWSLSFCHNRLGSQSPHALLHQLQDTERMPVSIGASFFKRFCCLALPGAPNCEPCFGVAVGPRFVCPFECSVIVTKRNQL